jgi:hypothetical protein
MRVSWKLVDPALKIGRESPTAAYNQQIGVFDVIRGCLAGRQQADMGEFGEGRRDDTGDEGCTAKMGVVNNQNVHINHLSCALCIIMEKRGAGGRCRLSPFPVKIVT